MRARTTMFASRETADKRDIIEAKDVALLAELGYQQQFKRQFTLIETFGVAFSIVGLVPSIASSFFFALPNGGGPSMVWGWLVASIFIMFISLALAELGSAAPTSGGLYYWTHRYSSPRCRNLLSWIVGYANTIGLISGVSGVVWGEAVEISACVSIATNRSWSATTSQLFAIYVAVAIATALVASSASRIIARLQNVYIMANLLLIFGLIISVAAATPKGFRNNASFALGSFQNFNGWPNGWGFIMGFMTPLWTIGAFDASLHISEEATNANIAVPYGNIASAASAVFLGWFIMITLAFCMGTDIGSILDDSIGQPMATILFNSLGKNGSLAIFICIVIVQFMMGTSTLITSSRQTFAFARDGALPGSRWISKINPYTQTPVNAVWFSTFIGFIMALLAFAGPVATNALFSLSQGAQYLAFIIPITARFLFKNDYKPGPVTLGKFGLPVAVIAVIFMAFYVAVICFPTTPQTNSESMNYSVVVLGGWFLLSLVWYYFPVYGGVHWFTGPIRTIGNEEEYAQGHEKIDSGGSVRKGTPDGDGSSIEKLG